jgi:hypothetical protein
MREWVEIKGFWYRASEVCYVGPVAANGKLPAYFRVGTKRGEISIDADTTIETEAERQALLADLGVWDDADDEDPKMAQIHALLLGGN